jgi:hypothetical protein
MNGVLGTQAKARRALQADLDIVQRKFLGRL